MLFLQKQNESQKLNCKSNRYWFFKIVVITISFLFLKDAAYAQFYRGSHQEFGKNRLQFETKNWQHFDFKEYNVYFYGAGRKLAIYSAKTAQATMKEFNKTFDYHLSSKIYILVFNNQRHFRESNIGLPISNQGDNIGGVTRVQGNKLFVFFEGDHEKMRNQIRAGIAEIYIRQMMFGENWKEVIKNSALLTLPEWYINGLVSYVKNPWSAEIDNRLRDGIMSRRFEKFNRLSGEDAAYAGHSLWNYIAEIYGTDVIPNVLYMARISRNIESGFLFVLGVSLNNLIIEAREYYKGKYEPDEKARSMPTSDPLKIKSKTSRVYQRASVNPQGEKMAYVTNELGQYKVYIYDMERKKKKKILKGSHKLDRLADKSYPLLSWHPSGKFLGAVFERKGEVIFGMYELEKKKWEYRQIRRIEKILDFSFSNQGSGLVFSGIIKGQTDLFYYKLSTNSMKQLTYDIYDERYPRFIPKTRKIIFSSNRDSDTLTNTKKDDLITKNFDVFIYDMKKKGNILTRVTSTPNEHETHPYGLDSLNYIFLSDKNGIVNRYLANMDSTISHIDTTIHYRYFTTSFPMTNYKRSILYHQVTPSGRNVSELIFKDGKYLFYNTDISKRATLDNISLTSFKASDNFRKGKTDKQPKSKIKIENIEVEEPEVIHDENYIDINNYKFENEPEAPKEKPELKDKEPVENSKFLTLKEAGTTQNDSLKNVFKLPRQENYRTAFRAMDITTAFDFNFANSLYQRFNGGPYVSPGIGTLLKLGIIDLLEDYIIEGGMRYSFNGNNNEYFLSYINRKKRLNKKFTFQKQTLTQSQGNLSLNRVYIHKVETELTWPFSEVLGLRGTANVRNDRNVALATDDRSLAQKDEVINWAGIKFELVFDNTREKGLNLYNGTRYKIFAEAYKEIEKGKSDIFVVGLDFRNYTKIHRDIIWANRLSASSSFGNRKLVYYMGSVDDWVILGNQQRFDREQNIARDQNYYFQTLAAPLRGFLQNKRNGNNFVMFNSEVRWPIFKYFINKPLKSDFIKNFQVIGFGDIGTAWTGLNPYGDENSFNTKTITTGGGSVVVRLKNTSDPFIGGCGFGLRSKILGYFVRFDYAWGIEDGEIKDSIPYFSLSMDF